jgi:hypothetical protein
VTIRLSTDGKLLAFPGQMRLAEGMRIERWDSGDTATAMACYKVFLAAHAADEPIEPPDSAGTFCTFLAKGHQRMPSEVWTAAPAAGSAVAGFCQLGLPDLENKDRAWVLLVKSAMLEWLASAEPRVERVATGNAASNEHMTAVNEALGYEVVEPGYRHCELAVAGVR